MIFGIGTDIVEVARMERALKRSEGLKKKLFTYEEQVYCDGNAIAFQHYAARFSAKEAFFKALGTGFRNGMEFFEINVKNDDLGKPYLEVTGAVEKYCHSHHITNMHLSISHVKETAIAFVVLENNQ
jgi:phosphopantethiene--protein transferase domain